MSHLRNKLESALLECWRDQSALRCSHAELTRVKVAVNTLHNYVEIPPATLAALDAAQNTLRQETKRLRLELSRKRQHNRKIITTIKTLDSLNII